VVWQLRSSVKEAMVPGHSPDFCLINVILANDHDPPVSQRYSYVLQL
jgi:hypothetical protein